MSERDVCSRCNKPLIKTPCYACRGSGTVRKWLISKEDCFVCNGSGIQFKCPNELDHLFKDWEQNTSEITQRRMSLTRAIKEKHPSRASKSRINVTINELNREGMIPPQDWWRKRQGLPINVPPWDYRYPYPWHPNHPRNPNRFRRK